MGNKNSPSLDEKFKMAKEKSQKEFSNMIDKNFEKNKEKVKIERDGNMKFNLTIRIYSDDKLPQKYKDYLVSIVMDDWKIIYLDTGFSKQTTNNLIEQYKKNSSDKKKFDEVLVIIIDSYESFINSCKDDEKNFLKDFNENLYIEEQPIFLFLNKNSNDFEYHRNDKIKLKNKDYNLFERACVNFISEKKEDNNNIEINYKIELSEHEIINSFLEKKKDNKDNFNIIFGNDLIFTYSSQYTVEDDKNAIHDLIKDTMNITIKNLDYNLKLTDDFEFLEKICLEGNAELYFEWYKPEFNKSFEDFLSQFELLDRRNFFIQSYFYNPFKYFQKFCGYYHEYGDALIKDKLVKYPSKINIGVCGRAGAGKSTLLNVILGEKRCLEGQGQSVSSFITSYSHPKYPISFIDFPGFGDKNHAQNLIKKIKEKNSQLKEVREEFHVIIYCVKFGERTFLDKEEDVIYELIKLNIKIIFVFTKGDKENSPQFKRFKNNFCKDLENILQKKNIKIDYKNISVVSIYSMKEERNGYTIEPFGVDVLFKVIYKYLIAKKIPEWVIEGLESTEDEKIIDDFIKQTELIKVHQSRKDIIEAIRTKVSIKISFFMARYLLSAPKYYLKRSDNFILSIWNEINDLMYEISCTYCKALDKDEALKLSNQVMEATKQFFDEGKEVSEELKGGFPWYARLLGMILYPVTLVVGGIALTIFSYKLKNMIIEGFEKDGKINISQYLSLFAKGLNEGIEGINKLSEEFKEYYKNNKIEK